jgi:hypothetical protein
MTESTFDPKSILETYRSAFAPVIKAQQEGVNALDRVGRYQYAVAGDYLEWSLAQAKLALGAQTPADFFTKQVELTTALSEKLRARAQEFTALATEAQANFTAAVKETTDKAQASFTAAVKETTDKVVEEAKKFAEPKKKVS